jgi:hypothetical protein
MAEPLRIEDFPDREDGRQWPAQGNWTYEDYLRLPDDGRRYEVLRGILYVSPAPSVRFSSRWQSWYDCSAASWPSTT